MVPGPESGPVRLVGLAYVLATLVAYRLARRFAGRPVPGELALAMAIVARFRGNGGGPTQIEVELTARERAL